MKKPFTSFGVVETLVALVVAALLGVATLAQLAGVTERTEAHAVAQMVATLRAALQLKVALAGGPSSPAVRDLAGSNPMAWLGAPPGNYVGEVDGVDDGSLKAGNWVFDRRDKMLKYLSLSNTKVTFDGARLLKFKVEWFRQSTKPGQNGQGEHPDGLALTGVDGSTHSSAARRVIFGELHEQEF